MVAFVCMLISLSRRLLALLLAAGVLGIAPVSAYDSDYEDDEREERASSRKKSKKNKKKKKVEDEDDYWDESTWEDDEVEPVVKKKSKKKKKKSKKSRKKHKKSQEESEEDSWDDDDDSGSDAVSSSDEADFFSDDEPAKSDSGKTAMGKSIGGGSRGVKTAQAASEQKSPAVQEDARKECIRRLASWNTDIEYVELDIVHPQWNNKVRIHKEQRVLVNMNTWREPATVLEFTEKELRVKWDNFGEERFLRQPDNKYMLDSMVKRNAYHLSRKASRVANRLRSRKAVPADEYGWTDAVLDYITGNEPPLTYEVFRLRNEQMDCKTRFSEKEKVIVRMEADYQVGMVLDYTGVKLHVMWEDGSVETFKRMEDDSYRKIDDERVARQLFDPALSTRQKSEDDWFQVWWRDVMNEEKPLTYVTVEMKRGESEFTPRISMDNRVLMQDPPLRDWAKVVRFNRKELILRWNGKNEEHYERNSKGVYVRVD